MGSSRSRKTSLETGDRVEQEPLQRDRFHSFSRLLDDAAMDEEPAVRPQFLRRSAETLRLVGPQPRPARHLDRDDTPGPLEDEVDLQILPVPEVGQPPLQLPCRFPEMTEHRR